MYVARLVRRWCAFVAYSPKAIVVGLNGEILMNEKCRAILAGVTGRNKRSQLVPYRDLISKFHQCGMYVQGNRPYPVRKLQSTGSAEYGLPFYRASGKEKSKPRNTKPRKEKPDLVIQPAPGKPMPAPTVSHYEIRQKIATLKQRTAQPESVKRRFEYDPEQPLHLVQEEEKLESFSYP